MQKLLLISIFLFLGLSSQSQITDLELANILISKNISHLDSILASTGYDYTITDIAGNKKAHEHDYTIYIDSHFGGIKVWEVRTSKPYRISNDRKVFIKDQPEFIYHVFVRYKHSSVGDLKEFKSYEKPANANRIQYEKEMGKLLSHLKLTYSMRIY